MYKIAWNTTKNLKNVTADVGDIRLVLKEQDTHWIFSMGIRVYTKDRSQSMVRPHLTITTFSKPCDVEEAKLKTEEYFTDFITSVMDNLIKE